MLKIYSKTLLAFTVLLYCMLPLASCEDHEIKKLQKEGILGKAKIIDCSIGSKGKGVILEYSFNASGKTIFGKQSYYEMKNKICGELISNEMSIIYIEKEPQINKLMLTRNDYNKLNYPFPDTLKWVEEFYFKW